MQEVHKSFRDFYEKMSYEEILEKYGSHLEHGQSEVRHKYDMSTIDGGKKVKLGNAVAMRLSTDTSLCD